MRYRILIPTGLMLVVMHTAAPASGVNRGLPLRNGRPVVATINSDAISLDEFVMQLGPSADRARLRQGRATSKELELLDRLVTIRLVTLEAATMGIDEAPEIRKQIEVSSREILREVLIERLVKGVTPDPTAVEKLFRDQVREWKTTSLLFQEAAEAQRARADIVKGAAFSEVAARAVAAKKARTSDDSAYHAKKDFLPQIADAIAPLRVGQVSPVIHLPAGFVVMRVTAIRYPPNPEARAEARKRVLSQQQEAFLKAHEQASRRKYVVVNTALVKGLDYASAKEIGALLKDKRVVADIKGGAAITVGDLTDYLRMQFFHGSDQAKQRKEMNSKKDAALDAMIGRRLLNMEALKLGLDKSNEYRDRVNGYRDSLIFDSFVQKVIVPDSKMKEDEVRRHYNTHPKEYSYPEMLKVRSLAFATRGAAENAARKLRDGTEYGWLAANADGQVASGTPGLLTFDGRPVTTDSMPIGMQKALASPKAGEFRLYASPEGHYYVLAIQQVVASNPRPYGDVRAEIATKLYGEKLKKNVEDYAGKLRAHSTVATYLKRVR